jgi:hypothetical protein
MANAVGRDFNGIRDFLKQKNPRLVLVGYHSLDEYDLSQVLSVDDFLTEDALIRSGIPLQNFRRSDVLQAFTDAEGRLKLVPTIKHCVVEWDHAPGNWGDPLLTYHCEVADGLVRWHPDVKPEAAHRQAAQQVAAIIGRGSGTYCFTCSIQDLELAALDPRFQLRFPGLNYQEGNAVTDATAKLQTESIVCYGEANRLRAEDSNERLKHALRDFGKPVTGRKEDLVKRVAELLAQQYAVAEAQMDEFFTRNRFVRIGAESTNKQPFAALQGHKLRGMLLNLYCLRHMRGNVVLEASHVNESVKVADLAKALLNGHVKVSGSFVPVV